MNLGVHRFCRSLCLVTGLVELVRPLDGTPCADQATSARNHSAPARGHGGDKPSSRTATCPVGVPLDQPRARSAVEAHLCRRHRKVRSGAHRPTPPHREQGNESEAMAPDSPLASLPPAWRMMLLSDGSVTRHLQLLTGKKVSVTCLEQDRLDRGTQGGASVAGRAAAGVPDGAGADLAPGPSGESPTAPAAGPSSEPSLGDEPPTSPFPARALASYPELPRHLDLIPGDLVQRQVVLHADDEEARPLVYAASWWRADEVDSYLRDQSIPIWASLSRQHLELYREILEVQQGHSAELEACFGHPGPFFGRTYFFRHGGRPLTLIYEAFSPELSRYLGE